MRPRPLAAALAALVVCGGCGGAGEPSGGGGAALGARDAVVRRVVDGDTLIARIAGDDERVRLLGVDAPESVAENRPVECFGPEASARLTALLPKGTHITLTGDPGQGVRDRFDRLLGEVRLPGAATTVNEQLVAEGFAEVFRGDGRGRLQPALRAAERMARSAGRGLWSRCRSGG